MPRRARYLLVALLVGMLAAPAAGAQAADPLPSPSPSEGAPVDVAPAPGPSSIPAPPDPPAPAPAEPPPTVPGTFPAPVLAVPAPTAAADQPPVTTPTSASRAAAGDVRAPAQAAPAETRAPSPPSDGVVPPSGQIDEYLDLTAQRDQLAARVDAARSDLGAVRATLADLAAQHAYAAAVADGAEAVATQQQGDVEDVARDMYQQGDGGIGAIATVLASGPDGLIDRLDNVRMVRSTARTVIDDAVDARARVALARATELALTLRMTSAAAGEKAAVTALAAAQAALAATDARLTSLSIVKPQTKIGPDGCPVENVPATLRDGSDVIGAAALCRSAVRQAATPQAALAITWAFAHLGAPYACGGTGRLLPYRMDCSSFVSRAYAEGAGLGTAGAGWAPSTRDMVPWDGVGLDPHYAYVAPVALRAGDLVLYDTCPQGGCPYKHVVMYLGSPDGGKSFWMAHTNSCGDIAKVEPFWGFPATGRPFLVARRVLALPGESIAVAKPVAVRVTPAG